MLAWARGVDGRAGATARVPTLTRRRSLLAVGATSPRRVQCATPRATGAALRRRTSSDFPRTSDNRPYRTRHKTFSKRRFSQSQPLITKLVTTPKDNLSQVDDLLFHIH
ncbi:hypothetical protein J6590_001343 [Homalodisca vitripennis]|nr:hypothetical protein J6590_001343 [Homalodisca vitripennis]